jgi:hypothetical protein
MSRDARSDLASMVTGEEETMRREEREMSAARQ